MSLIEKIRAHLARQEEIGWHQDWPQALIALRAVLDLHDHSRVPNVLVDGEVATRCHTCGLNPTKTCATVQALADALEVSA